MPSSAILLVVSVALGAYAAPRVDLRSHLLARVAGDAAPARRLREEVPVAAGLGATGGLVLLVADAAFAPFVPPALSESGSATLESVLAFAPVRFLYGGVTEELLLRFG